jgi:hypothetical protein
LKKKNSFIEKKGGDIYTVASDLLFFQINHWNLSAVHFGRLLVFLQQTVDVLGRESGLIVVESVVAGLFRFLALAQFGL